MKVAKALEYLRLQDRKRLEWSFEAQAPDFIYLDSKENPGIILGVHLDKVDSLDILDRDGDWFTAKKKPTEGVW